MNQRRLIFISTLVAFAVWVACLGTMAILSGRKPMLHSTPKESPR